jgi:hypothetical protein
MTGNVCPSSLKRVPGRERPLPEGVEALPQGEEVPGDAGEVLPQGAATAKRCGGVVPEWAVLARRGRGAWERGEREIPGRGRGSMGTNYTHIHMLTRRARRREPGRPAVGEVAWRTGMST